MYTDSGQSIKCLRLDYQMGGDELADHLLRHCFGNRVAVVFGKGIDGALEGNAYDPDDKDRGGIYLLGVVRTATDEPALIYDIDRIETPAMQQERIEP